MNASAKGRRFEHEIVNLLKSAGFSVTRGAGSKGECFGFSSDLIATKAERLNDYRVNIVVVAAQCKIRAK